MRYTVYIDCDCIAEYNTADEAIKHAQQLSVENPDSVIDALDDDEEISLWGIN